MTSFSKLGLKPELLATLDSLSYTEMTPIQQQSLPEIIKGRDLIGQGKTGSGKTAAFGLGLLEKLDVKRFRVQALVLCPTRELADQVAKEIRRLARGIHNIKVLTLCGGMPFGPQIGSLEHGAHIIVGTPGRVDEHLRKGNLTLENLSTLVLDEADRMLEMGFTEVLNAIVDKTPKERQTLLFSATFPDNIKKISSRVMRDPVTVKVESTHADSVIEQRFFEVDQSDEGRLLATRLLLHELSPRATVIFCNTKREVQQVADELDSHGFSVLALHGDLEQRVPQNLNISFAFVEGESLLMSLKDLAVSSGSACTSASLEPSYVLRALGLDDELAHSSIRFSFGRFTTEEEIDFVIEQVRVAVNKLRDMSPLWDMYKEGIDLSTVEWAHH